MNRRARTIGLLVAISALVWWLLAGGGGHEGGAEAEVREGRRLGREVGVNAEPAKVSLFELRRAERAAIAGHVRDPQGRPIAGATVCAGGSSGQLGAAERAMRTCATSEEDGGYRIEGLLPVPHFVHASAPRFVPAAYRRGTGSAAEWLVRLIAGREAREIDITLAPGGVELTGVVRDLSGGVLEGALVAAGQAYARSGAEGQFSLWVKPGSVYVHATAEGYVDGGAGGVAPGHVFEISLTPESVLVGRVVRAGDGAPVAGAQVLASGASAWSSAGPVWTDESGNFRLEGLRPGAYKAEALHDEAYGMAEESAVLGLGETSAPVVIVAHPAYSVEGTVQIAGGGACERGSVRLGEKAGKSRHSGLEADGSARLRGVLPGTYEVTVACDGYVPQERYEPLTIVDAPVRGLRWEVRPGQAIRGRVTTADGEAIGELWVQAEPQPDPEAPRAQSIGPQTGRTEADGRFELRGLLPGRYRLRASGEGYPQSDGPVEITLPPGQDLEDIRITLPATGELRGTVRDSQGEPVKGAEVRLRGERAGLPSTQTADDGSFRLARVPAGTYRAVAGRGGKELRAPGTTDDDVQGAPVTIAVGEVSEVQLVVEAQSGRITGRVVDADGGPLVDAFVEATRERDGRTAPAGRALLEARWGAMFDDQGSRLTDADGHFELTGLGEGSYTLIAQRRGGGEGTLEHVTIGSEVVIRIAEAGSLAGTVRLAGGGTPQQFTVRVYEAKTGWSANDEFFRTGGLFRFPELPRGDYSIAVESPEGSSTASASVGEGERAEVRIELAPRVTVRGRLVDAETGAPVPGMEIDLRAGVGTSFVMEPGRRPRAGEVTDVDGRFVVEKVPAGEVVMTIMPKDWVENGYPFMSTRVQVSATTGASEVELPPLKIARNRVGEDEVAGDLGYTLRAAEPGAKPAARRWVVGFVQPGGPASQAGLQIGDEIVRVDGVDVTGDNRHLYHGLTTVKAGATVRLGLARGETIAVTAGGVR